MRWRGRTRLLACYTRDGELVGERPLPVPVDDLRRIFRRDADDDVLGVFAVGEEEARALGELLGEALDVHAWRYYVESFDVERS
jgi:hypothetical protein